MQTVRFFLRWIAFIAVLLVAASLTPDQVSIAQPELLGEEQAATEVEYIAASPAGDLSAAPRPSAEKLKLMQQKHLERREEIAARGEDHPPGQGHGLPHVQGKESKITEAKAGADPHAPPSAFVIGHNSRNTVASSVSNTLAEPAAANERGHIFYTGNTYASLSTNGGKTWKTVDIPLGPADAPNPCCDIDVIHDWSRGVTFWSVLYLDEGSINGVVRIFVRRNIPAGDVCSYTIDPGGTANNILPDYPHLGLSDNFLYLSTNNIQDGFWAGSQVRRFNIEQMVECESPVTTSVFTFGPSDVVGQRVFVPVDGARDVMYWGALESSTEFRIFKWLESSPNVFQFLRPISPSTFENPDCRGGVDDFDFIESRTAWNIRGFRLRGAVGAGKLSFFWNVGPDSVHMQGHVHAAVFRESDLTRIAEPPIFNNNFCFGYPVVGVNDRGHLGLSIAAGGKAGGGGTAARGFVSIADDFVPGTSVFGTFVLTADGTHNPFDQRYGDYFTIHRQNPCGLYWAATNYALLDGNTDPAHVNTRYVEFGRGRDKQCYISGRSEEEHTP